METVRLRDGSEVQIRPVEPGDKDAVRTGFDQLGAESRYKRFLSLVSELTAKQLDYLTEIDHHDHEALVAIANTVGVGVARFVRLEPGGERAEVAVAAVDDWQGRGLGTVLLNRLSQRAGEESVTVFTAAVLTDNRAIIDLLGSLGSTTSHLSGAGQLDLEIELEGEETLQELMRNAASGAMRFAERARTWRPRWR